MNSSLEKLDPAVEWSRWEPTRDDPFDARKAAHLLRRAGFGHTPAELEAAVDHYEETWERLLKASDRPLPKVQPPRPNQEPSAIANEIRAEWLQRMLGGGSPLREKMTLFWHNHFATSIAKIQDPKLMKRQNDLLRHHALGKFGDLLRAVGRDPAMLIWLDSNQNVKSHPNENYAREVMELFSLGVGTYKEKDIQEAARAFTGWHVASPAEGGREFVFRRDEHDFGRKTILGKTGDWDGDDVIAILLEQPACPQFLVRKLYTWFVNDQQTPPDSLLKPLADELKKSGFDIGKTVETMLRSRHFFSAHAYRRKVKSPVDYCVGVARVFGTNATGGVVISPYSLVGSLELQGQQLYQPPNVKGWEGGRAWLNTATVLARHNFAYEICNGMKALNQETVKITGATFAPTVDPLALHRREDLHEANEIVAYYGNLLHPGDLKAETAKKLVDYLEKDKPSNFVFEQRTRDVLYALLTLPDYQLC